MASLATKIELFLGRKINFMNEVVLEDVGQGVYIKEWNIDDAQPTQSELDALESQAQTVENNIDIINTRKKLYGSWQSQLEEIYDDGIDSWKTRIAKVKTDNPKE
jgi:prefoldin subunit 5